MIGLAKQTTERLVSFVDDKKDEEFTSKLNDEFKKCKNHKEIVPKYCLMLLTHHRYGVLGLLDTDYVFKLIASLEEIGDYQYPYYFGGFPEFKTIKEPVRKYDAYDCALMCAHCSPVLATCFFMSMNGPSDELTMWLKQTLFTIIKEVNRTNA